MIVEVMTELAQAMKQRLPELTLYRESVMQGIKLPALFIFPIESERKRQIGGREQIRVSFALTYIPREDKKKHEQIAQVEDIMRALEEMVSFRAFNRQVEYNEETVQITFDVQSREQKVVESSVMNKAEIQIQEE